MRTWFIAVFAGCGLAGINVVQNWGFSEWDGDRPRDWELSGSVERAPTWHPRDYAVSLLDRGTTLTQVSDLASACMHFRVIADVVAEAEVQILIDVRDDGVIDETRDIPASEWAPLEFFVRVEEAEPPLRVTLVKKGDGRAVIANVQAVSCP